MSDPYVLSPEPDRPQEWTALERSGTGDYIIAVEWDPVKDQIRSTGPKIQYKHPVRPQ